jgi:hypothetical protein
MKENAMHEARALVFTTMVAGIFGALPNVTQAPAKPWQLRKITTSNVCLVQTNTASPIGALVSEHDSRKEACQAAKDLYDDTASDVAKCCVYGPATKTGCKADGIDLP